MAKANRWMALGAVGFLALLAACGPSSAPKGKKAPPPEVFWRCRGDGYRTNLAALTVRQMMGSNQYRYVEGDMPHYLLKCPACGRMEMEQIMLTPEGEVRP
jgi:hypothetical protein